MAESRGGSPAMCEGRKIRGVWGNAVDAGLARGGGSNGKEEGVNAKVQDNYPHGWQCVFHFDQVCVFLRSPIKPLPEPVPHLSSTSPRLTLSLLSFSLPLHHCEAWWVGNRLLSFPRNVLIILNSNPRASNLWCTSSSIVDVYVHR